MKRSSLAIFLLLLLAGCGGASSDVVTENIARVETDQVVANDDLLVAVAKEFYKTHPDEYDMLVMWGAPEFAPGHSFYLTVKNDVTGIGYQYDGPELFDNSADYGSQNLQGIIWMGPDWRANADNGFGPRSVLGILAQETGHRWAATIRFKDPVTGEESSALLEDPYHWNFYLNTGASPMGGNKWESLGDGTYRASAVSEVEFCPLDLYLMGLIPAEEVLPMELMTHPRTQTSSDVHVKSSTSARTEHTVTITADVVSVTIDQIIEAEGRRDPDVGFNAKNIRQAWIYVYPDTAQPSYSDLNRLGQLQETWTDYFEASTGGRSIMDTVLY